ncbi:MAG: class I SAM-dependent methyltransferase [Planctomycetota bacterium]
MDYREHEVEWTGEKVRRFWDFIGRQTAGHGNYFARQVGDAVVELARAQVRLGGPVLDYGAGDGSLLQCLLDAGVEPVYACEYSPEAVEAINRRFANDPRFKGCFGVDDLPAIPFEAVFLLEAIEHLAGEGLEGTLAKISRALKPGGVFVVTTPNSENLAEGTVACPDCGAVFHRMQHVNSFTPGALSGLLARHGFEAVFCGPVWLRDFKPGREIRRLVKKLLGRLERANHPHLVYIGTRMEAA